MKDIRITIAMPVVFAAVLPSTTGLIEIYEKEGTLVCFRAK
jgi:hypothetical protein